MAHVLALDSARVTVQCLRMGGGFGGKEMQLHGSPPSQRSALSTPVAPSGCGSTGRRT